MDDSDLNFWLYTLWGLIAMLVLFSIFGKLKPIDPNSISNRCERLGGSQSIHKNDHLCLLADGRIIDLNRNEHIGAK